MPKEKKKKLSAKTTPLTPFEILCKEAKARLERDPTSNPYNFNLDLFDVDKVLARPYRRETKYDHREG